MPLVCITRDCKTISMVGDVPLGTTWVIDREHLAQCLDDGTDPLDGCTHRGLTLNEWNEGKEPEPWPQS